MNTEETALDTLVATFASEWVRLDDSQIAGRIVADPILVLGPEGTSAVPRSAFLAAVAARSDAVDAGAAAVTVHTGTSAQSLGARMVLATIRWSFSQLDTSATLVSDFLLLRQGPGSLCCVAYPEPTSLTT